MSRKHFIALARAIALITDPAERARTAELVADVCKASNADFDRARFYAACGISR